MADKTSNNIPAAAREELIHLLTEFTDKGDNVAYVYSDYMTNKEYTRFVTALNILEDLKTDVYNDLMTCGDLRVR